MAFLFSLLFTLVLLAVGFVVFCVPTVLAWLLFDRLALARLNKGFRFTLPLVLVPLSYTFLIASLLMWFTRPAAVYEMAFGFSPAEDVSIISSSHSGIGDFGEYDLTFTADKSTIDRILHRQFDTSLGVSNSDDDGCYRFKRDYSETFASETAELEYNPYTKEVRYRWQGID